MHARFLLARESEVNQVAVQHPARNGALYNIRPAQKSINIQDSNLAGGIRLTCLDNRCSLCAQRRFVC